MNAHRVSLRGFALISAIFLIVILAALGTFMLSLSNTQHLSSAQDVQGARAYWAAKAGLQWAVASISAAPSSCPATTLILDGVTVTVTCTANSYTEGTTTTWLHWVTATATIGGGVGGLGHAERVIDAFIEF